MNYKDMYKRLKAEAKKKAKCDREDFDVEGCSGGSLDSAYNAGLEDGAILLAREILGEMNED